MVIVVARQHLPVVPGLGAVAVPNGGEGLEFVGLGQVEGFEEPLAEANVHVDAAGGVRAAPASRMALTTSCTISMSNSPSSTQASPRVGQSHNVLKS